MERPQNSLQDVDVRFDDLSLQDVDVRFDDLPLQDVDVRFDNLSLQDVDVRFDNLPDRAVHHIFCFLRLSDLARLSAVSKRCRELCISNPNLRTPKLGFKNMDLGSNKSRGSRFNNFLDRFMALRCLYGVKTQSFRLRWSFEGSGKDEEHQVERWLQQAINSGATKVRLKVVHPGKPFALPLCVLGCDSLRVDAGEGFLKFPKVPYFATKLRSLALGPFRMEKDCNIGELLSSFKSLKKLRLEKIKGIKKINITSSSIEILAIVSSDRKLCDIDIQLEKLCDLFLVWTPKYPTSISLKISAPNLQTFHLAGYALDHYCMRDSPDLLHATISLKLPAKSRGDQASIKDNFNKVLHSVQKARRLNLQDVFVEALFKHGCLPFSFDNVEYLAVGRTSSGDQVLPLSSLLRGTTNLKHLSLYVASVSKKVATVINSIPSRELSFNMEDWQSQNLMFTHHQLKKVTVELFDRENEVELMKYLLKNAEELEVMAIFYTSPVSSDLVTELRKYKKRPSTELHLSSTMPYNKRHCIRPDRRPM